MADTKTTLPNKLLFANEPQYTKGRCISSTKRKKEFNYKNVLVQLSSSCAKKAEMIANTEVICKCLHGRPVGDQSSVQCK